MNYDAHFGNKLFSINQRRYLGSKTKLLHFIEDILRKENIDFKSFADIFAGTGAVANHFRDRSKIIVNDILESNYHAYNAFFGNEKVRENRLKEYLLHYNSLDINEFNDNYFSKNFSNTYFDAANSKKIGIIRENIEQLFDEKTITTERSPTL
ncbi:MAG: DNA adenine methylase [bacterium]